MRSVFIVASFFCATLCSENIFAEDDGQFAEYKKTLLTITGILDRRYSNYYRIRALLESCGQTKLSGQLQQQLNSHLQHLEISILPHLYAEDAEAVTFYSEMSDSERRRMILAAQMTMLVYGAGFEGGLSIWDESKQYLPEQEVEQLCAVAVSAGRDLLAADEKM